MLDTVFKYMIAGIAISTITIILYKLIGYFGTEFNTVPSAIGGFIIYFVLNVIVAWCARYTIKFVFDNK